MVAKVTHTERNLRSRATCPPPWRRPWAAFTVVEALVAMALAGLVASSLLLTSYSGINRAMETYETFVAYGLAEQIMDEIVGQPYREKTQTPYQWPLGTESDDGQPAQPAARNHFDDLDDYHNYASSSPLTDRWGYPLTVGNGQGGKRDPAFQLPQSHWEGWSLQVAVAYVPEGSWDKDLTDGQTTDYRSVTVVVAKTVAGATRELARIRRVVGYIPGN